MPTTTPRLGLSKPALGDLVKDFQGTVGTSFDTLDNALVLPSASYPSTASGIDPGFTLNLTQGGGASGTGIPIGIEARAILSAALDHMIAMLGWVTTTTTSPTGLSLFAVEGRAEDEKGGNFPTGVLGLATLDAANNTGTIAIGVRGRAELGPDNGATGGQGATFGGWFTGLNGALNYDCLFGDGTVSGYNALIGFRGYNSSSGTYAECQISVASTKYWTFDLHDTHMLGALFKLVDTAGASSFQVTDSSGAVLLEVDSNFQAMPRSAQIMASATPKSTVGVWTPTQNSAAYYASYNLSDGAQNSAITFDWFASAGTYTIDVFGLKTSNSGIYTVSIDGGASVGTLDFYNASTLVAKSSLTGVVVAGNGAHTITLKMATKNASSSSYFGFLSAVTLVRTA